MEEITDTYCTTLNAQYFLNFMEFIINLSKHSSYGAAKMSNAWGLAGGRGGGYSNFNLTDTLSDTLLYIKVSPPKPLLSTMVAMSCIKKQHTEARMKFHK